MSVQNPDEQTNKQMARWTNRQNGHHDSLRT